MFPPTSTADLCDRHLAALRVPDLALRQFGGVTDACGTAVLVSIEDDNRILFDVLDQDGEERVLIVQVEGASRPAVVGEKVASLALSRRWAALLIDGSVRDTRELASMPLCILAREARPFRLRSGAAGRTVGELTVGTVGLRSGEWVAIDQDGVVFAERPLAGRGL